MKRTWLIGAALVLGGGTAISCGDDSGGTGGDDTDTRRRVAEALTEGISFDNGTVRLAPLPETTDEDLTMDQDDAPVTLSPGTPTLIGFDVENPDEDDPVVATLLQFEDAEDDEHIEVDIEGEAMPELMLDVADDVCDSLCADNFAVKLIMALKTEGGRIGERVSRTLMLTCEEDGPDAEMCESAQGDGDGDGDAPGDGDGDGDGEGPNNATVDNLRRGAAKINIALQSCDMDQWLTDAELDCIEAAVTLDESVVTPNLTNLAIAADSRGTTVGASCDRAGIFDQLVTMAAMQELPDEILECDEEMDSLYSATADGGVPPAP